MARLLCGIRGEQVPAYSIWIDGDPLEQREQRGEDVHERDDVLATLRPGPGQTHQQRHAHLVVREMLAVSEPDPPSPSDSP